MNIIIYLIPKCKFCIEAVNFLKSKNIKFTEFDVSKDPEKAEEMKKKSGQSNVPVLDIDNKIITGFNETEITRILYNAEHN